jgi:hypothetical protein
MQYFTRAQSAQGEREARESKGNIEKAHIDAATTMGKKEPQTRCEIERAEGRRGTTLHTQTHISTHDHQR